MLRRLLSSLIVHLDFVDFLISNSCSIRINSKWHNEQGLGKHRSNIYKFIFSKLILCENTILPNEN